MASWVEVVASKPGGYFDPASLCLLEVFCSAAAILRQMSARMNALDPKDREYGRLVRLSATMSGTLSTMATRLRLCQSRRLRHEDGRLNERAVPRGSLLGCSGRTDDVAGTALQRLEREVELLQRRREAEKTPPP